MKVILWLLLFISGLAYGQQQKGAAEVDRLHRQKFTWLISKNYDSLNWLMDDRAKYIHSNGWIQTKQEVIDDLKSNKLNYTAVSITESDVVFYGTEVAIVTGKGTFKGLMPDKTEFKLNLLYSEVYVRYKKQWWLTSRLATKI